MRIRIAVPDPHVTPALLNAALEATTKANESLLETGAAPLATETIRKGLVKWKPENFRDGEHFDLASTVARRGWGDCDDLAPWLAAELRMRGIDPGARAVVKRSGPKRWHAVVHTADGDELDPSIAAGMLEWKKKNPGALAGVAGAIMGTMAEHCALGLKRRDGKWAARCDLPVMHLPTAICGVALERDPATAATQAIDAAMLVGGTSELVHPYHLARAIAIQGAICGEDLDGVSEELEDYLDEDEVGSIFSSIAKGLGKVVPGVAKLVPIPGVSQAVDLAQAAFKGGGGGGARHADVPGLAAIAPSASHVPHVVQPSGSHGPIIVKF